MKISKICDGVNRHLAGEQYPYSYLELYLDEVIDDINDRLSACFPSFSEFLADSVDQDPDYDCFPDMYIRSVVMKGAAYKFFTTDEEGIPTAQQFGYEYTDALFKMTRDYTAAVPLEYQADRLGSVDTNFEAEAERLMW